MPKAVKLTAWEAKAMGPSSTWTCTTPVPSMARAADCIRSMADSRAEYMASVKLVSSTFWFFCFMATPADRRGA